MFAIIKNGGKQYKVEINNDYYFEKMEGKEGDVVSFDEVLAVDSKIGNPLLAGASVKGTIEKQGKEAKITVIKFKRKKHYSRKQGHRQAYTKVKITEIKG